MHGARNRRLALLLTGVTSSEEKGGTPETSRRLWRIFYPDDSISRGGGRSPHAIESCFGAAASREIPLDASAVLLSPMATSLPSRSALLRRVDCRAPGRGPLARRARLTRRCFQVRHQRPPSPYTHASVKRLRRSTPAAHSPLQLADNWPYPARLQCEPGERRSLCSFPPVVSSAQRSTCPATSTSAPGSVTAGE